MRIRRKSNSCMNCGFTLDKVYNYCPNCGQDNNNNNVSFNTLVGDFFSTYFSFDSRFVHTFKPFFIKPGELTLKYISGRRAYYAHPLRLYLIVSLFYFFVFSLVGKQSIRDKEESDSIVQIDRELDDVNGLDEATRSKLSKAISSSRLRRINDDIEDIDSPTVQDLKTALDKNLRTKDKAKLLNALDSASIYSLGINEYLQDTLIRKRLEKILEADNDTTVKNVDSIKTKEVTPTDQTEDEVKDDSDKIIFNRIDYSLINELKDNGKLTDEDILDSLKIGEMTSFEERIARQTIRVIRSEEEQLAGFVLKNLPFMMLLLIPIFALVLKVLYFRRKELYIKHLIHAFHLHSFAYLFYGVSLLIMLYAVQQEEFKILVGIISFILVSTYAYISFLKVYKQHWFKTWIKFNVVGIIYNFLIFTFFVAEMMISIFFY